MVYIRICYANFPHIEKNQIQLVEIIGAKDST